jgi:hypothetical protein
MVSESNTMQGALSERTLKEIQLPESESSFGAATSKQRSHFSAMKLLDQFLKEDATPHVRDLLLRAIEELELSRPGAVREFTFNRFNVTIDSNSDMATLQDDLDTSEAGELGMRLSEFAAALRGDARGRE